MRNRFQLLFPLHLFVFAGVHETRVIARIVLYLKKKKNIPSESFCLFCIYVVCKNFFFFSKEKFYAREKLCVVTFFITIGLNSSSHLAGMLETNRLLSSPPKSFVSADTQGLLALNNTNIKRK